MQSIRVAGLISISHASKIIVALITIKLLALSIGPDGLGYLANYMSLVSLAASLAGGGVITGIVKYVSQYKSEPERQQFFIGNALLYCLLFSLLVLLFGVLFSSEISFLIFGSASGGIYICIFAFAQLVAGFVNFSYGVINGFQENAKFALVSFAGSLLTVLAVFYFIGLFGLAGAVLALTAPLVAPIIPLCFVFFRKKRWFSFSPTYWWCDFKSLNKFTLMLLVSAACFPVVEIFVRNAMALNMEIGQIGLWQSLLRLTSSYLGFFSVFLAFYLVPRVSNEGDPERISREVFGVMGLISALFVLGFGVVVLFGTDLVVFVLSDKFSPVNDYLAFQMIGDYFRVMGWAIGFLVVAKAATKIYVAGELLQGLGFLSFFYLVFSYNPTLEGAVVAYVINCFIYFVVMMVGFLIFLRISGRKSE